VNDNDRHAIAVHAIGKRFGAIRALDGVDLEVPPGTVCAVLGPNGAGKTTLVRILTTLLRPDFGTARVAGCDVVRDAERLRYRIGLAGQYAAVDGLLTGRDNLIMVGRLYHLPGRQARQRADDLLERFDLADAGNRLTKTYSGGMRRRLDLAASLIVAPPVLFLDEPTTGLDPRSRSGMWEVIGELVAGGTTLLLTTQYMEEADRLADQISVIDAGQVIAEGTPAELKDRVGGAHLDIVIRDAARLDDASRALQGISAAGPRIERRDRRVIVPVPAGGARRLTEAVRELDAAAVVIDDIALRRPTLDEVFLTLTGHNTDTDTRQPEGAVR